MTWRLVEITESGILNLVEVPDPPPGKVILFPARPDRLGNPPERSAGRRIAPVGPADRWRDQEARA